MENKINLVEILKDCPQGMELDCTICNSVVLEKIEFGSTKYPIILKKLDTGATIFLTKYGQYVDDKGYKCVIFPKGMTSWKAFVPPCKFNAGDVLVSAAGNIVLYSHIDSENFVHYHCILPTYSNFRIEENTDIGVGRYYDCTLANEQQRQRMYDEIKRSGYKYNSYTNKLEKLIIPKFKEGDVVTTRNGEYVFLLKNVISYGRDNVCYGRCYFGVGLKTKLFFDKEENWYFTRLATENEKQKFFDCIKAKGYRWNAETKILEKLPRFKVGDRIKSLSTYYQYDIKELTDTHYTLVEVEEKFEYTEPILEDKNWELVPNKFDITTLKPFDKVLVRHDRDNTWCASLFSHIGNNLSYCYKFVTTAGKSYQMCIPYKGNEHLLGTTNDCNDFYKIWE